MIKTWLHKGLRNFYETIPAAHARKIAMRLTLIDEAQSIQQLNMRSLKLHQLKGNRSDI